MSSFLIRSCRLLIVALLLTKVAGVSADESLAPLQRPRKQSTKEPLPNMMSTANLLTATPVPSWKTRLSSSPT